MWMVSGKRGNSSLDQWKRILAPVIEALQQMEWLSGKLIHLVADREFASPKLAEWLKTTYRDVDATLRIKASMYLSSTDTDLPEKETKIASLIQKMVKDEHYLLYNQILTRASTFPMNILLTWKKEYDEPLVVATTSHNPDGADKVYGLRFGIEPMHKDWKTNAFELEKTRVTEPKRIETLLNAIAFAYILCVLAGELKEDARDVRKPPKGKNRMVGLFLDGIRAISRHIRRATMDKFREFISALILPLCRVWNIHPSDVLPI